MGGVEDMIFIYIWLGRDTVEENKCSSKKFVDCGLDRQMYRCVTYRFSQL